MHFVPAFDKVSHPVDGNRGAAVGHKKQSHGGIMPHLREDPMTPHISLDAMKDAYLSRPFDAAQFLYVIESILEKSR